MAPVRGRSGVGIARVRGRRTEGQLGFITTSNYDRASGSGVLFIIPDGGPFISITIKNTAFNLLPFITAYKYRTLK